MWAAQLNTVSKFRDQFGRRVVLLNLGKWDPTTIPVEDWFASTFVLLEVLTKVVFIISRLKEGDKIMGAKQWGLIIDSIAGGEDSDCWVDDCDWLYRLWMDPHQAKNIRFRLHTLWCNYSTVRNLGVNEVRLASAFLAGSFPLWTRRIHFINQPRIFSILMNVVKPFLSENAKDVIVFHE